VLGIAHALRESHLFVEVVPSECSVLVTWNVPVSHATIREIAQSGSELEIARESRSVEIPIIYDGLDLVECADALSMTVSELIQLHSQATYTAAFAGFAPGFLYLTGVDSGLHLPRRSSPRTKVPQGSLAMADIYTAIYPLDSPGGWNLLGRTTLTMFDALREPASILQPGDSVRFVQVFE
jgi:KipI family sensor histidine kinase inhibitor